MSIQAVCSNCQSKHKLNAALAGKKLRCPKCLQPFAVTAVRPPVARPAPAANSNLRLILSMALGMAALMVATVITAIVLVVHWTPTELDRKLAGLKDTNSEVRMQAVGWLAVADPDDLHRAEVTAAVESMLFDDGLSHGKGRDEVLRAYLHWAGSDNRATLIRLVRNPALRGWLPRQTGQVMEALGKLKEIQAAGALAEKLSDPALHDRAVAALQLLGAKAEPAVLDYFFDPDPATRQRARTLLADYGTPPSHVIGAALTRLNSHVPEAQLAAAVWFQENPPDAHSPRGEVARALAGMLDDLSPELNTEALRALRLWWTRDCLPQLVALAQRRSIQPARQVGPDAGLLIDVLAQVPEASAADAIALELKYDALRGKAEQALLKLGSVARPAILGRLNHPDPAVHQEARRMASLLKISAADQLDQTLADVADAKVARARTALNRLAQTRPEDADRGKVSRSLNAALLASDPGVRADAVNAVAVWGTRANTGALLELLGDNAPARNLRIMEVLGALQDPVAAIPLAQCLIVPRERDAAGKALKAIGAPAEKAVIPYLQSSDRDTRFVACFLLGEIGTEHSLPPLTAARANFMGDIPFVQQVDLAAQQIANRGW
jgi:HEAT repeat protein